jgi:hypothetical protein
MDVNEWTSYECSDEAIHVLRAFVTNLLVHMHQKEKIALEIAAKFASVTFLQLALEFHRCTVTSTARLVFHSMTVSL